MRFALHRRRGSDLHRGRHRATGVDGLVEPAGPAMTAALSPMTRADVVAWRIRHMRLSAGEARQILARVAETFPAIVALELDELEHSRNDQPSPSLRSVPPSP